MRAAQQSKSRSRLSTTANVTAPVGGWNALDSIANMPETDAVILDNIFPLTNYVQLRAGCSDWCTGLSGTVETLGSYNGGNAIALMAGSGGNIYNVTAGGAVGAPLVTAQASNRWQHVNMSTAGGSYMYWVNGTDSAQIYNGTAWQQVTGVSAPIAITGVTTSTLINVMVHQARLWFIQINTLSVWYLAPASVGGAATQLNLSSVFSRGGYLVSMGSWSMDSGTGMRSRAVFITSEGECAVYEGTDPASAATWFLVGIYTIGEPVGYRCLVNYGGDMLILCQTGLFPLSQALLNSRVEIANAISNKIQFALSEAISSSSANFGWEITPWPNQNMLVVNVPITGQTYQYVMNTITGAWCRFYGWNSSCYETSGIILYFGAAGKVCKAWDGVSDSGVNINAEALQAFSYFNSPSQKYFVEARPILLTNLPNIGILLGLNIDYDTTAPVGTPSFSGVSTSVWDAALWDTALWSGSLQIRKDWQTVGSVGYAAALHMKIASNLANLQWASTAYLYQPTDGLT